MKYYAGLDISTKQTSIAIVDSDGNFMLETVSLTDPKSILEALGLSGFSIEKIGLEAGNLSFWLMRELNVLGVYPICIDTRQMSALLSTNINKTDKNDARWIANAMRCNLYKEVHHKSLNAIEIGLQMGVRRTLVNTRTMLKNTLRGHLKVYGKRLDKISHKDYTVCVRESIAGCDEVVQIALEALLKSFEEVCKNIEAIDKMLEKLAKDEPVVQLFESIPGVGAITSLTYISVIDNPHRFKNPRDVGAYIGCTPRQNSSGDTISLGKISKCGSQELRSLLSDCARVMLTRCKEWSELRAWGLKIKKKHGLGKAITAVARKLAAVMLRMWQKMEEFKCGKKKEKAKEMASIAL